MRNPLRGPAVTACLGLAERLRSDVAYLTGGPDAPSEEEHDAVLAASDEAVSGLRRAFLATPYRPTGLSTPARTLVRLVDELSWLNAIVVQATLHRRGGPVNPLVRDVKLSVATLLEECAHLLADPSGDVEAVRGELDRLGAARGRLEDAATTMLPLPRSEPDLVTSLEPSFRAQEMSFAASQIAANVYLTVVAERRGWVDRVLGRQPGGLSGPLAAAQERAFAHADRHSVWLHNSIRGAIALGLAVLVADLSGVQHSFWVVLATLSVLRSNALNIGQNAVRGLGGTVVGFVIGAALLAVIGTSSTVLWVLLPFAILVAGIAPAAISFAAGQAAFTVTLVILFNIIAPAGWRVGLVRVEDIAIGCVVSLVVGLLFWPRGAASALRQALAEAYTDTAHYLSVAVEFGMQRCESARRRRTRACPADRSRGAVGRGGPPPGRHVPQLPGRAWGQARVDAGRSRARLRGRRAAAGRRRGARPLAARPRAGRRGPQLRPGPSCCSRAPASSSGTTGWPAASSRPPRPGSRCRTTGWPTAGCSRRSAATCNVRTAHRAARRPG